MQKKIDIAVFTSGYDLITSEPVDEIKRDVWSQIYLPGSDAVVKVWYAGINNTGTQEFKKCLQEIKPSVVYLNGMFSFRYVMCPLFCLKRRKIKLVLCPRGMLQTGALAGKSLKKKLYLSLLKMSGLVKNVVWHATNAEEERDIKRIFGQSSTIIIAMNIPRKPLGEIPRTAKKQTSCLCGIGLGLRTRTVRMCSGNCTLFLYRSAHLETIWPALPLKTASFGSRTASSSYLLLPTALAC